MDAPTRPPTLLTKGRRALVQKEWAPPDPDEPQGGAGSGRALSLAAPLGSQHATLNAFSRSRSSNIRPGLSRTAARREGWQLLQNAAAAHACTMGLATAGDVCVETEFFTSNDDNPCNSPRRPHAASPHRTSGRGRRWGGSVARSSNRCTAR